MTKEQEHVADSAQCWPSVREREMTERKRERNDSERDQWPPASLAYLLHRSLLSLFDVRRGFSACRLVTVRHLR